VERVRLNLYRILLIVLVLVVYGSLYPMIDEINKQKAAFAKAAYLTAAFFKVEMMFSPTMKRPESMRVGCRRAKTVKWRFRRQDRIGPRGVTTKAGVYAPAHRFRKSSRLLDLSPKFPTAQLSSCQGNEP
jgi:hypothetical protein